MIWETWACWCQVFAFVNTDKSVRAPHRAECHVCECPLEYRTKIEVHGTPVFSCYFAISKCRQKKWSQIMIFGWQCMQNNTISFFGVQWHLLICTKIVLYVYKKNLLPLSIVHVQLLNCDTFRIQNQCCNALMNHMCLIKLFIIYGLDSRFS